MRRASRQLPRGPRCATRLLPASGAPGMAPERLIVAGPTTASGRMRQRLAAGLPGSDGRIRTSYRWLIRPVLTIELHRSCGHRSRQATFRRAAPIRGTRCELPPPRTICAERIARREAPRRRWPTAILGNCSGVPALPAIARREAEPRRRHRFVGCMQSEVHCSLQIGARRLASSIRRCQEGMRRSHEIRDSWRLLLSFRHSLPGTSRAISRSSSQLGAGRSVGGPCYDDRVSETSRQSAQRFGGGVQALFAQMCARVQRALAAAIGRLRMYELYSGAGPEVPRRPVQNLPASPTASLVPPTADVRAAPSAATELPISRCVTRFSERRPQSPSYRRPARNRRRGCR
jgi:hypothetical protein